MTAWREYQEQAATLFRELGFDVQTDLRISGARGSHDVDVFVSFERAGLVVNWIIECKHWKRPVDKSHVLTLRSIVEDAGADRGILLSESGAQRGALAVTHKSNVHVTSIIDLKEIASGEIVMEQVSALPGRVAAAHARYWAMSKSHREEYGLRPEGPTFGYSGAVVLAQIKDVLFSVLANQYPPTGDTLPTVEIHSPAEALSWVYPRLEDLEQKLGVAEKAVPPFGPVIDIAIA
ncbi:restriction endonuclease [Glaciibacter superstes]|uniref:restriction endonuclease n=1 Tax=Glaciibacter superstes TaxID=501023 RepID=UPI0003B3B686|nr:restriction endonuclease [Glaciibacter superstes]